MLGQALLPLGQGPGQQCTYNNSTESFNPHNKTNFPREGGGVLSMPTNLPRNVLIQLESIGLQDIEMLEERLKKKKSAKDQKDALR